MRKTAEDRWFPRYHTVTGAFKGRLLVEGEQELEAKVIDVSRDGLGILVDGPKVKAGELVELEVDGKRVPMNVVYCTSDLIHAGSFRCGLQRRPSSSENLVSLFAAHGMIAKER